MISLVQNLKTFPKYVELSDLIPLVHVFLLLGFQRSLLVGSAEILPFNHFVSSVYVRL